MRQIRIAVIENEEAHAKQIVKCLQAWQKTVEGNEERFTVTLFSSGEKFLNEKPERYTVVFMDIQLDGQLDGMGTARRLRRAGGKQEIIFLTSHDSYVFDGYEVDALDYLMKPVVYQKIEKVMNKALNRMSPDYYLFQNKDIQRRIPYDEILYFQSDLHYIEIKLKEGLYRQKGKLSDIEKQLPPQFVRCHRINIVNIQKVVQMRGKALILENGENMMISSTYKKEVERALMGEMF